jgi:hypothetical protein
VNAPTAALAPGAAPLQTTPDLSLAVISSSITLVVPFGKADESGTLVDSSRAPAAN